MARVVQLTTRTSEQIPALVTTVLGDVDPGDLGHTQTHEHLFIDLTGELDGLGSDAPIELYNRHATRRSLSANPFNARLDEPEIVAGEVAAFKSAGGGTLVDVSPIGLGRNPTGLRDIARRTGVHIVMGTGFYVGAFHPAMVADASVAELADVLVDDCDGGGGADAIRPGIIGELGMSWPVLPAEGKCLEAAVAAQRATGLALSVHPGRDRRAPGDVLERIAGAGGDLERTIICHIDRTLTDPDDICRIAAQGATASFDLFGWEESFYPLDTTFDMPNDAQRLRLIRQVIDAGYLDRILISQDICSRTSWQAYGGEGYSHILTSVVPLMLRRDFTSADVDQICRLTPARLLSRAAYRR